MLLVIPDVLTAEQVASARKTLAQAEWIDGRATAGHQSIRAKDNLQLAEGSEAAVTLGEVIIAATRPVAKAWGTSTCSTVVGTPPSSWIMRAEVAL